MPLWFGKGIRTSIVCTQYPKGYIRHTDKVFLRVSIIIYPSTGLQYTNTIYFVIQSGFPFWFDQTFNYFNVKKPSSF